MPNKIPRPLTGHIDVVYPRLKKIAVWIANTGRPKTLTADDLTQVAAIAYCDGKIKSFRDARAYMTAHIRSERQHGTMMDRGRTRRKHMAVQLDLMTAKDEGIVAGVITRDLLRKLPKKQADALLYVEILGYTEQQAGRILGVSQKTISLRIAKVF